MQQSTLVPFPGAEDQYSGRGSGRGYAFAKRTFDILFALAFILLTLPVWIAIAVAVKVTSPGPVFFAQPRVGKNAKVFMCLKFRTMRRDAEAMLQNTELGAEFEKSWKLQNDPRVTPIVRKTSLDELPQLLNVLKGEMSVVGPRPVQVRELAERFGPWGATVASVRPGLTSLWSVSGRSALSYPERVRLEVEYVRRRSFWFDLKLVCLTVPAVIKGSGAV